MYSSYATFAAVTVEVTKKPLLVKWCWIGLLIFSGISIIVHISKAVFIGPGITTRFAYGFSRLTTIAVAGFALMMAWKVRTTVFQKTIIIGSYVYAFFGMFSVFSFIFSKSYFGLSGVEPYMIGSFIDIIIFSGALGYRFKKIADEKNKLLQQFLETAESKGLIAKSLNDNVGAALSSMHIYASVAESLVSKDPNKSVDFLKQIKENSLQIMDDVNDIIWALKLSPAGSIEALPLRIKQHGLEILATYHIACNNELEEVAMLSIHDVATAKTILTQVKQATLLAIKPSVSNQLAIAVRLVDNAITINIT